MKLSRSLKLSLTLLSAFLLLLSNSPLALSYNLDYRDQTTFFRGVYVTSGWSAQGVSGFDIIRNIGGLKNYNEPGSIIQSDGYVIPNKQNTTATSGDAAGGAIGTSALNITSVTDSSRKQKLFDLLKRLNDSGTTWEKMGSALVVHQMLGKAQSGSGWGDGARDISDSEWSDLANRLVNNPNLIMEYDPSYYVLDKLNTAGVKFTQSGSTVLDAITVKLEANPGESGLEPAWVFKENGAPKFVLEVNCANPIGAFGGLPPYEPIPEDYSLTPKIQLNKTSSVEPGDEIEVDSSVQHTGQVNSRPTIWQLVRMVYSPSTNYSSINRSAKEGANDACGSFTSSGRSYCQAESNGNYNKSSQVFTPGQLAAFPDFMYTIDESTPVGTKICFTTSVSKPTHEDSPVWRHAELQCVIVAKKPKMHVWGGDVRVGDALNAAYTTLSGRGRTFGSWSEYGAFSNDRNDGFASGSGLIGGNTLGTQSSWSKLTFANSGGGTSCPFGCFGFTPYAPSITGQFLSDPTYPQLAGTINLSNVATNEYRAGNLTISGGSIAKGKSIVIISTGTVTIDGNITYEGGLYSKIEEIPQVVIKASTINIKNSVTTLDSWLIATTNTGSGVINTCSDFGVSGSLTVSDCANRLQINGPVVVDKLYLRRTGGATGNNDAALATPAEIFNLRADAYLWGNGRDRGSGEIRTVYSRELPPRF